MIAGLLALVFGLLASFFFGMLLMLIIGLLVLIWIGLSLYVYFKKMFHAQPKKRFKNRSFTDEGLCIVKLVEVGHGKTQTLRILCQYCDWDIATAQQKIESELPIVIAYDMPVYKAEDLLQELQEVGTLVEIYKV